tara:strand:+ start:87526 stop:88404 length:879 start_codon:yes stop_codon:yes gene_type:complete
MFFDATQGLEKEGDWENFKNNVPGNLALVDGLISIRPEDESLLVTGIKGYAGYSFGVHETLYLNDLYAEKENSKHRERALNFYSKAISYGMKFLSVNDIEFDQLRKAVRETNGVKNILESELGSSDLELEGVLFTAQALGSYINLQRTNMALVAQLPIVKSMFDWVCEQKPDIAHGTCQIFYASYEAGRPSMLGGNPEKGKEIFESYIRDNPNNWLARVAYIQYYIIPMSDEDLYAKQKIALNKFTKLLKEEVRWTPDPKNRENFSNERLKLYQSIAVKRFKFIKKYENDLF